MTFESVQVRDTYLPRPEHEVVKAALLQCIDSVLVFDFEAAAIAHLTSQPLK